MPNKIFPKVVKLPRAWDSKNLLSISQKRQSTLSIFQGTFYLVTGLWPIVSIKTFEKVTGPKTDDWLVKTVGILIAVSGVSLLKSGMRSSVSKDLALNAAGQALSLGSVSLFYSLKGQISKIYLADTVVEYTLVALWYSSRPQKAA